MRPGCGAGKSGDNAPVKAGKQGESSISVLRFGPVILDKSIHIRYLPYVAVRRRTGCHCRRSGVPNRGIRGLAGEGTGCGFIGVKLARCNTRIVKLTIAANFDIWPNSALASRRSRGREIRCGSPGRRRRARLPLELRSRSGGRGRCVRCPRPRRRIPWRGRLRRSGSRHRGR